MKLTTSLRAIPCLLLSLYGVPSVADTQAVESETATGQAYIASLAAESLLTDIEYYNGSFVAVGERGHVLVSNNGEQWQQMNVPTQSLLTAVTFNGEAIWAVGHDAVILGSKDDGKSWQVAQFFPELERPLLDVFFKDPDNGIAIGAYGIFYRTTDGGNSWLREYHTSFLHPDDREYVESLKAEDPAFYKEEMASILPHLNRVSYSEGRLYVAGETGLVAYSDNFGESWVRVDTGYYGSFFDIKALQDGSVLVAGLRGSAYISSDEQLQNWQRINTQTTTTFNSVIPIDKQQTLLIGNNGIQAWLSNDNVQLTHTDDGKALVAAILANNQLVAVSEVGIKSLALTGQESK